MPGLSYGATTHVGRIRSTNEDSYVAAPELGLWLVADGMGGQQAGEVASAVAAFTIYQAISRGRELEDAIHLAHEAVLQTAQQGLGGLGMGTTVVALRVRGDDYQLAWVGDSRAYSWDLHRLRRLTRDHSVVQELVDAGAITDEQAKHHPQRNIITQSVGVPLPGGPEVGIISGSWAPGQSILLCSDGLSSELADDAISRTLSATLSPQDSTRQLLSAALDQGGHDNITVLLVAGPRPVASAGFLERLRARLGF